MKLRVAVAQATPALLDLERSVDKACAWIADAGARGVRLLAFPETWLPGYPFWCDGGEFGAWGNAAAAALQARLVRESLGIGSEAFARLRRAARDHGVALVLGVNERSRTDTLYNALLFVDEEGELVGHRRKLVPTFGERLVWGYGDAADLGPHTLAGARVGGLVCWEHWMPLPRHALHGQGEQIHVAAWPHGKPLHQLASRHYAFEGGCFVLVAATYLPLSAVPEEFELEATREALPDPVLPGGSAIVGPAGKYVVEPVFEREELLVAEIDLEEVTRRKLVLDTGGHYARPDLFQLRVRRDALEPDRELPGPLGDTRSR